MSNKKSGLGLLFGIVAGTALGILFAPRKGKDIRENFRKEIEEGGSGAHTLKTNIGAMGKDIAETATDIYEKPEVQKSIKFSVHKLSDAGKNLSRKVGKIVKENSVVRKAVSKAKNIKKKMDLKKAVRKAESKKQD